MWILTLRSPTNEPIDFGLKPGKNTLGRKPDNYILIADESASRLHAEIYCQGDLAVLHDLGSTNGTFVNQVRLTDPQVLKHGDQIRIGEHIASVAFRENGAAENLPSLLSGTHPLTRELLLESVDQNAVLLYEVANRLAAILDLETALEEVSKLMKVVMGAEKCELILAERFSQIEELGFSTAIAQEAILQRSVVVLPDRSGPNGKSLSENDPPLNFRSALCVPVIIDQDVVAIIFAYKVDPAARPFDQHDVQLAVAISHQAALTIHRAQLLDQAKVLEQWATTDTLTGVYNRRQVLKMAESEVERALRYHHPLSVLMLDIDDFKKVNDTYGHIDGDQVLQAVAARFKKQIRDIDLVGRFGGDEFMLVLLETSLEDACTCAERIRSTVMGTPLKLEQRSVSVTVSIGVAAIGEETDNLTSLLRDADNALYTAKQAGKNRVEAPNKE